MHAIAHENLIDYDRRSAFKHGHESARTIPGARAARDRRVAPRPGDVSQRTGRAAAPPDRASRPPPAPADSPPPAPPGGRPPSRLARRQGARPGLDAGGLNAARVKAPALAPLAARSLVRRSISC